MPTEYEINSNFIKKIQKLLNAKEYEKAKESLDTAFFSEDINNKFYYSEESMLYFIMLEIYFLENYEQTIWQRFVSVDEFKSVFWQLKFYFRRIWLQFPNEKWIADFILYLEDSRISIEMLIVIAKYSCPKDKLIYCVECLKLFLQKEYEDMIEFYENQLKNSGYRLFSPNAQLKLCDKSSTWKYIELDVSSIKRSELSKSSIENNKFAIILCSNSDFYLKEVLDYIECIKIPQGMTGEIIVVKNANSMAVGYNIGMDFSNAKYKFYIHQDTFLIDSDILLKCLKCFKDDESLGMLGIFGAIRLPKSGFWWRADKKDMRMSLYQDAVMDIKSSKSIEKKGEWEAAEAIDGVFIATSVDVPWREDLFDNWHFYDISQCYEIRKNGYLTGIINSDNFLVLHETSMKKDSDGLYEKYCKVFLDEYLSE